MDLSAPITYNGLTARPATVSPTGAPMRGISFNRVDPSSIRTDAYYDDRANDDGVDAQDILLRERMLRIDGAVYATSKGHLWDELQDVLAAFHPVIAYNVSDDGFLPLAFRQPTIDTATWTAGYIPLQFYARPVRPVSYSLTKVRTADVGKGLSIPFSIDMIAKDPRKYAQAALSVSVGTAIVTDATYRGDYTTWPIVTFTLSASGSSAFVFTYRDPNGNTRDVTLDLSGAYTSVPGQPLYNTYELNFRNRSLTRLGNRASDLIATDSEFYQIAQAPYPRITSATTGLVDGQVTMTYREAWV
jgi:hypothetical protein